MRVTVQWSELSRRVMYWPRVVGQSLRDTVLFFDGAKMLIPPSLFVFGAVVHLLRRGDASTFEEIDKALSFGLYAFLIFFGCLWIWNLLWTPPRMEANAEYAAEAQTAELREQIAILNRKLLDREKRQAAISKLWELRSF